MKGNILIVDDHPGICLLLYEVFSNENYNVHTATTGKEALEKIKDAPIDLILIDNNLPIISGLEVIRWLEKKRFNTPVILMSGASEMLSEKVIQYSFVTKVLTKPFNIDELKSFVEKILFSANET